MDQEDLTFYGTKYLDYEAFYKCILFVNNKEHLTVEGYNKILTITKTMNSNRTY